MYYSERPHVLVLITIHPGSVCCIDPGSRNAESVRENTGCKIINSRIYSVITNP